MRFPSRLLAANVWLASILYGVFVALVTLVALGVAIFGEITESAWEKASQIPRWYALFAGLALVTEFLPLYVAHGQTRRQFGGQAAVTVVLFAPFLAALLTVGYLVEAGVYHLVGWDQVLSRSHLFTEPTQLHLVFLEHLLEFLTWLVVGALIGSGFYRWQAGGVLLLPVGVGLVLLTHGFVGNELRLPVVGHILTTAPADSLALAVGVALASFLAGLALTWLVIRDIPLRNKISA